jgi:hypothetical protein
MEKRQLKLAFVMAAFIIGVLAVGALTAPLSPKAKATFTLVEELPLQLYDVYVAGEEAVAGEDFDIDAPIYNDLWGNVLVIEFKVKNLDTENNYSTNVNVRVRHKDVDLNATTGSYANITGTCKELNQSDDTLMGYQEKDIGDTAHYTDGFADSLSPTGYTLGLEEKEDTIKDFLEKDALASEVELAAGVNYLWIKIYIKIKIDFDDPTWDGIDQGNWKIRIWIHGSIVFP